MSKKNYLMEAAAEVLAKSISSAPKQEADKIEGTNTQELGGPTPTEVQKEKIDYTKGVPSATPPGPAAPVGQEPSHLEEEEEKDEDEKEEKSDEKDDDDKEKCEEWKKQLKEDVTKILASESNLSEAFRTNVATIYEARVTDKVNEITEQIEADFAKELEKAILELREQFSTKIDEYLDYVVEQWMKENEVAIETGLRNELAEEFICGMRNLFAEHYIDVPEEKVNVVEELAEKVASLETELNEEIKRGMEYKKQLTEAKKDDILKSVCEGLTDTQVEKIRTLAESVEFTAEGEYQSKLEAVRENFFPTNIKPADAAKVLTETLEPEQEKKPASSSPEMQAYVRALGKTVA